MRSLRFRLTVRRVMVVVAGVALLLGAELMRRRRAEFGDLARSYAQAGQIDRFLLDGGAAILRIDGLVSEVHGPISLIQAGEGGGTVEITADPTPGYDLESLRRRAAYHSDLRRKYERAARYPWLSVPPDPPRPK